MARVFRLIMILFWLPIISAQYGGGQSSSSTTTTPSSTSQSSSSTSQSSSKAVHSVDVGEKGFTFSPDTLTVAPGEKVEFHFYPGDHSVAQASFDNPCHPSSDTGIWSGFQNPTSGEQVRLAGPFKVGGMLILDSSRRKRSSLWLLMIQILSGYTALRLGTVKLAWLR